jgi:NAD(P)-dependent dehydrogenase (short-subunit alcohol dehydrogenase family)
MANVALITGGSLRIGRAITLALAADGWAVVIHYNRSADAALALAGEVTAAGGRAATIGADLSNAGDVENLMPGANRALGPVTALINNASLFERDEVGDVTVEGWDRQLAVNLRAPFFLSQAFAGQLPEGVAGNIVNLIDMRVWRLTPHFVSYTVAKAGLWTLTQTMAMALAPRGIRVNAIGPGPVLANERQTAAQFDQQWRSTPLGRGAHPEEIADGVRFILSAKAMTGQMIALDGGQHLPWPLPAGGAADLD